MTRKLLLLPLLIFGCSMTPKVGHTTYQKGQSIMESPKVTLPLNGDEIADNGTATVQAPYDGKVNMHISPDQDSMIILTLTTGDEVKVLGKEGGWLLVRYNVTHRLSFIGYVWAGCFVGYEGGCR